MEPRLAVPVVVKPAAVIAPTTVMVSTDRALNIFISGCLPYNAVSTAVLVYILGAVRLPSQDMFPFA